MLMALTLFLSGAHSGYLSVSASTSSTIFSSESSGNLQRQVAENQPASTAIGAPVALENPVGTTTYSLSGSDADSFSIDSVSGQLQTTGPLDYETRSRYTVAVTATDEDGSYEIPVYIRVTDLEEPGTVTVTPTTVHAGQVIRGQLIDPDGGVSPNKVIWRWSVSADANRDGRYINVAGGLPGSQAGVKAEAAAFTPSVDHAGKYLKVSVQYSDRRSLREFSLDNTAEWISDAPIAAAEASQPLTVRTIVSDLTIPWDIAFTPDGTMLFTERGGSLHARFPDGRLQTINVNFSGLHSSFSVGLMSLAIDPDFNNNRRFYTCQAQTTNRIEIQVISWTMDSTYSNATRVDDPLVGSIDFKNNGWHGGCRIRFGPDGYLWITTGDGSIAGTAQDINSLAGKILRVNAQTGEGAPDNPFSDPENPSQKTPVYSYGHRNPQGLAFRPNTKQVWVVGHGPDYDDEINLIVPGGNYGWNPTPPYNENVPMTNLEAFPNAIAPKWQSGFPAIAPSGAVFLDGQSWGAWNGRLAVTVLKQKYLKIFEFTKDGTFISETTAPELDQHYGRLRSSTLGPDDALYITTSNGSGNDKILQVFGPAAARLEGPNTVSYDHLGTDPVATFTPHNLDASVTWTLSGQDATNFDISAAGVLSFRASPRVDTPADADADNIYHVLVIANDDSSTANLAVQISVARSMPDISITAGNGITEGENAVFTLTASPTPTQPLPINITITQQGDFGATTGPQTVTMPTSGTATVTINTADDDEDETNGSITATITSSSGYTISYTQNTANVSVADNDNPPPTTPDISIMAGNEITEGENAVFTLTASPTPTQPLPINITITQQGDFGATTGPQTVTMPTSGTATVTINTADDDEDETNGSITATITSSSGNEYTVSSTNSSANINVSDNDNPPPADCGSAETLATKARANHDALPNTTANKKERNNWWRAWIALSGTTGTYNTPLTAAEAQKLESNDSRWTPFRQALECLNGTPPPTTPDISITAGNEITEGENAVFTLTASPTPTQPLPINITITQQGDFGATTGPQTVTMPTSGTATVTINTADDDTDETNGSITATITSSSGNAYTVSSTNSSANINVADNDNPPVPDNGCTKALANSGTVQGRWESSCRSVTRSGRYARFFTFSLDSQASVRIDLESSQDTYLYLRRGLNQRSGSDIARDDDSGQGRNSRIARTLSAGDYTIEATTYSIRRSGPFTLKIAGVLAQNPPPIVVPEISITAGSDITEGGDASFTVSANPSPTQPLQVNVTITQTGNYGATTGSHTVTMPTSGTATVTINTADDDEDETNGSITATITSGSGYTISNTQNTANVSVADNDNPPPATPEISITAGTGITEGENAVFTLTASPTPTQPLPINITIAQQGDFGATTGPHTITVPTSGTTTLTITTTNDNTDETNGSITATITSGSGYTISNTQNTANVSVADNDNPPPANLPKVSVSNTSLVEGGAMRLMEFRVTLDKPADQNVTIRYTIIPGTVKPSDYFGGGGWAVIWANRTGTSIYVFINDDNIPERNETLFVELVEADGATITNSTATGTIIDDD